MPAVTFGGIGSGMDVEGLISGLVNAEKVNLQPTQQKVSDTRSAISAMGDVAGLLAKVKSAAGKLSDEREVASYSATSSGTQLVATTTGAASPSSYDIEVTQLASEQRTYSDPFSSKTTGLLQTGSFNIQVGTGAPATVNIDGADSLESITNKINTLGLRVSASIFNDGGSYRLQIRGLDSGSANNLTFSESGTTLGLLDLLNTKQAAQNALVKVDGFPVTSATNKIDGAIFGVSLAVTAKTTAPITLRIAGDPGVTKTKVSEFISTFNAVIDRAHLLAGFGTSAAQNAALAGDSALRGTLSSLASVATGALGLGGSIDRLSDVGVSIDRTGHLTLSDSKFAQALADHPAEVIKLLGGAGGTDGVMDKFKTAVDRLTDPKNGLLFTRKAGLETRAKTLDDQLATAQTRIDHYAATLRTQFTAMDGTIATNQALLKQLG